MTWLGRLEISKCLIFSLVICLGLVVPSEGAVSRGKRKRKKVPSRSSVGKEIIPSQVPQRERFERLKRRIAVIDFENKSDFTGANVGRGVTDMLITALNKSGRFIIVEREKLEAVLREESYAKTGIFSTKVKETKEIEKAESIQNIGISGYLTPTTLIKIGDILKVDAIATGGVAEFGPSRVVGWTVTTRFKVGLDMHLVDARRGNVLGAEHVVRVSDKRINKQAMEGVDFRKSEFLQGIMGMTAREVVNSLVKKTINAMVSRPWEGMVVSVEGEDVYINAGSTVGLREGDRLIAFREGKRLVDPLTGALFHVEEKNLGMLEIIKVEKGFSICRRGQKRGQAGSLPSRAPQRDCFAAGRGATFTVEESIQQSSTGQRPVKLSSTTENRIGVTVKQYWPKAGIGEGDFLVEIKEKDLVRLEEEVLRWKR